MKKKKKKELGDSKDVRVSETQAGIGPPLPVSCAPGQGLNYKMKIMRAGWESKGEI